MREPLPVLWLMGPTSAGKSTLGRALTERLRREEKLACVHWDGDLVRGMLGDGLGFSAASRLKVVEGLVSLAAVTAEAGVLTVVSALTAHEDARALVRASLPRLWVVYVHCPIETCMERDPKGLYGRARAGEIDTLIGYNDPYVPPEAPDLEIDTASRGVDACVDALVAFLDEEGALPGRRRDGPGSRDSRHG